MQDGMETGGNAPGAWKPEAAPLYLQHLRQILFTGEATETVAESPIARSFPRIGIQDAFGPSQTILASRRTGRSPYPEMTTEVTLHLPHFPQMSDERVPLVVLAAVNQMMAPATGKRFLWLGSVKPSYPPGALGANEPTTNPTEMRVGLFDLKTYDTLLAIGLFDAEFHAMITGGYP
jgi:hypothetical protein